MTQPAFLLSWLRSPAARSTLLRRGTVTADPTGGLVDVDIAGRSFTLPHLGSPGEGEDVWVLCTHRTWLVLDTSLTCTDFTISYATARAGRCILRGMPGATPTSETHTTENSQLTVYLQRWDGDVVDPSRLTELVWLAPQLYLDGAWRQIQSYDVRLRKNSDPYLDFAGASVGVYTIEVDRDVGASFTFPPSGVTPVTAHATNAPGGELLTTVPTTDPTYTAYEFRVERNSHGQLGFRLDLNWSMSDTTWTQQDFLDRVGCHMQVTALRACY